MADLKVALEDLREESDSRSVAEPVASVPARRWTRVVGGRALAAAIGALALGAWWQTTRPRPEVGPRPFLTRLTSDVGWTDYPAISLDGKILAYASDRSGDDNLDVWVQQIPDGSPVRLTRHAADEVEPSFSADGSRIAFRSSRLGGGIYVVPTLGGEERLLAARGFSPRFSPDGPGSPMVSRNRPAAESTWLRPPAVPATPVTNGFYRAQAPVWSPDGRQLLFWAQRQRDAPAENNTDWYAVAVPGGSPVPTEARNALLREGFRAFQGLPLPDAWVSAGNRVLFQGSVGDSSNIWQVAISPESHRVNGPPQRATFGTTDEAAASVTVRRANGVHQPDDGGGHLELADRRKPRESGGAAEAIDRGCCRRLRPDAVRRRRHVGAPVAASRPVRRRAEKARAQCGDRPDQRAGGLLSSSQSGRRESGVLVSREWQDAHLCRRLERGTARASVRRLWRSGGVVAGR